MRQADFPLQKRRAFLLDTKPKRLVRIVRARKEHLPGIRRLYEIFAFDEFEVAKDKYGPHLRDPKQRGRTITRVLDEFSSPMRTWFVALYEDEVVGTALLTQDSRTFFEKPIGRIDLVVVDPEYRKKGVGRALLKQSGDMAEAMGIDTLMLEVLEGNEQAVNLYESAGFEMMFRAMYLFKKED